MPYLVPVLGNDVWLRYRWRHNRSTCRLGAVLVVVVFVIIDAVDADADTNADPDDGGRG